MKILFLNNVPSPYRIDFFNELGKYCDLTVIFEKDTSNERDKSWKEYKIDSFKAIFLKGLSVKTDSAFCPTITKYLSKEYDHIVCTTFTTLTGMYAINYMRKHNIHYFLEADGGFAKNSKGIKERIKKYFISNAKGYFSTGKDCDEYYLAYGAVKDKIIRYPFTSIYKKDILDKVLSFEEKQVIKNKLNINEKQVVLSVGQFIYRKGFDLLLESIKQFNKDIGFYFAGGTATKEYLQIVKENNLYNVHFVGYKSKDELSDYYKSADLFVLPTREDIWGLVIEEAMAKGLPIISTDKCSCANELVKNTEAGFIVSTNNADKLIDKIKIILSNKELQQKISNNSLEVIKDYTIENMVNRHLEVLS